MPKSTQTSLTGAHFRELRHRIKASGRSNYSAARFAADLGISESLLQFVETGQRAITPDVARAYKKVERDFIYCLKEIDSEDAQTAAWLVEALARHAGALTTKEKNKLEKIIRGAK